MKRHILQLLVLLMSTPVFTQTFHQTVRGRVLDDQSKMPLVGATVVLVDSDPVKGVSTDVDGYFVMADVPVGRQEFKVSFVGYVERALNNIVVVSGKETVMEIGLTESFTTMDEVKVVASTQNREGALNAMAAISARQITVEETRRYAGSFFDPARMASSFAGVSSLDGESNEIIVRGNSPRGVLWRLEGVEIPNPNHFRDGEGATGGSVAMVTSDVMSNSDFLTGAFPAEYGNALSGVFDIGLRKGNAGKREYSFQLGLLGFQASAEGPFKKVGQSSYLINYRHAVFEHLYNLGIAIGDNDIQPAFDDLAVNLNFVTKKAGHISVFGLGGKSSSGDVAVKDSAMWEYRGDKFNENEFHRMGLIGIKHFYPLKNNKTYFRTVAIASNEYNEVLADTLDYNYLPGKIRNEKFEYPTYRFSFMVNHKFNRRNTVRAGAIYSFLKYSMIKKEHHWDNGLYKTDVDQDGSSYTVQAYGQWQNRLTTNVDLYMGMHFMYFGLNGEQSLEPRASVKWRFAPGKSISYGTGLHSRVEALSVYLTQVEAFEREEIITNNKVGLTKSFHQVIGYDWLVRNDLRIKLETYYQYLYNVLQPVDPESSESGLNILNGSVDQEINNEGKGYNYGLEFTLEKFFSNNYYYLFTASLFESKYTAPNGEVYNTVFNGNYIFNGLFGKEINLKNNATLSLNGKIILKGGQRYTPIDVQKTIASNNEVYQNDKYLEEKNKDFIRADFSTVYRKNKAKLSWEVSLDIQNVTNRKNIYAQYWDSGRKEIMNSYFPGLLPILNYRLVF